MNDDSTIQGIMDALSDDPDGTIEALLMVIMPVVLSFISGILVSVVLYISLLE